MGFENTSAKCFCGNENQPLPESDSIMSVKILSLCQLLAQAQHSGNLSPPYVESSEKKALQEALLKIPSPPSDGWRESCELSFED